MSVTDTLLAVPCCQGGTGQYHTLHRFDAEREREDNAGTPHAHTYKRRWTAKTQGDMLPYTDFLTPTDQSPSHQPLLPSAHLLPLRPQPRLSPSHKSYPSLITHPSLISLSPSLPHLAGLHVVWLLCVLALLHGGQDAVEQSMALPLTRLPCCTLHTEWVTTSCL